MDRLIGAPQLDKGSWIGSKMTRPSLDKLGNWLEGRFTSFIAGEGDTPSQETPREHDRAFSGPFSHYTQITSTTPSAVPTPQRSMTDLTEVAQAPTPPYRSGSAMALRPPASHIQINRASSAMDYIRRKASPVPRVSSANAVTPSFADYTPHSSANGFATYPSATSMSYQGSANEDISESSAEAEPTGARVAAWWSDPADSGVPTPTATSFTHVNGAASESNGEFISLMSDSAHAVTPIPPSHSSQYGNGGFDEDDDLGLGNSRRGTPMERSESVGSVQSAATDTGPAESAKVPEKPGELPSFFLRRSNL